MTTLSGSAKKILVIDDEEDLRDIIQFQCQAKGHLVTTANDGIDALEKLKKLKPDLIILDLNMPRMGGIEFYQRICGADGKPIYPVIVLTARANTRQLFMEFEVDGFMTKPFEVETLIEEMEIVISRNERTIDVKSQFDLRSIKNIFIADHMTDDLNKISSALLNAGYKVSTANTGSRAIEKMMVAVPDIALINLGLEDVPGDVVVQRLLRMAKTKDIRFVLYMNMNGQHDRSIIEGFSKKDGIVSCFEYSGVTELLSVVDKLLIENKR